MMNHLIKLLISFCMLWSNVAYAAQSTVEGMPQNGLTNPDKQLDSIYRQIDKLWAMLEHSQYDPDALLDSLNFEGEQIIQYVKKSVHFQAYKGALRGPVGTLISQSGNALDQSLLLAKLLKDAGYEARIVRGKLPKPEALRLLQGMKKHVNWPAAVKSPQPLDGWLQKTLSSSPDDPNRYRKAFDEYISKAAAVTAENEETLNTINQALVSTLPDQVISAAAGPIQERLIAELEDYFWVEYQLDASSGWQVAHPTFSDSAPLDLTASEYFPDEIPKRLQHRVRFQVFLERTLGGKPEVIPLMSPWERPAANAAHKPQSIMLAPHTDFESNGQLDIATGLKSAKFYVVFLNGKLAPDAQVFTLEGLVGPPDALSESGEFIATVSEKGLSAASALSEIGSPKQPAQQGLTRIWIEYSTIAPGGETRTITRDILSTLKNGGKLVLGRSVPKESWKSNLQLALVQSRNVGVATGPVSPAYFLSRYISHVNQSKRTITELLRLQSEGKLEPSVEVMKETQPLPDLRPTKFFGLANGDTGFHSEAVSYLAEPMMVTFGRGINKRDDQFYGYEQTDILFNKRRSLDLRTGTIKALTSRSSLQGIKDTIIESLPAATNQSKRTTAAFPVLRTRIEELKFVGPSDLNKLDELGLGEPAAYLATKELQAGYGLILANNESGQTSAWWRVDLKSGTLTGMGIGPGGYGGVTAGEWLIVLVVAISVLLRWIGYVNCFADHSGLDLFCCLVDSYITNVLVALLAFAIATLVGMGVGGVGALMGAEMTAELELVITIINTAILDIPGSLVSFTDFKLEVCGSLKPPPPYDPPPCPPPLECPIP